MSTVIPQVGLFPIISLYFLTNFALGSSLNSAQSLGVKVATPVGTFFGQLLFGWLADVVGRKKMCMLEGLTVTSFILLFKLQMVSNS